MSKSITMSRAFNFFTIVTVISFASINKQWYNELFSHQTSKHNLKEMFRQDNGNDSETKNTDTFHNITDQITSINNTFSSILKTGLNIKTSELLNKVNKVN
jgi:hypothetical protein